MLCVISQITKPKAKVMPAKKVIQNHRAKRAPARTAIPTTIGAIHPVRPRMGLGKPKTLPWAESRFALHCTTTLKSHEAGAVDPAALSNFSNVRANAAIQPITPAITSQMARILGRASTVCADMLAIIASTRMVLAERSGEGRMMLRASLCSIFAG